MQCHRPGRQRSKGFSCGSCAIYCRFGNERGECISESKHELLVDTSPCPFSPKGSEDSDQVYSSPEAWADALVVVSEKHGYDKHYETPLSIRRVQAGLIGKGFSEFIPLPFGHGWK